MAPASRTASMRGQDAGQPVERVEDAEEVDAGRGRLLDEAADDVVGVVGVADGVRPAQEHLEQDVGDLLAQQRQALPGVLVQEAHGHVEGGAAPHLEREQARQVLARTAGATRSMS